MRRKLLLATVPVILLTMIMAQAVPAGMFRNTFVPEAELLMNGRIAKVTAEIECTAGEQVLVNVVLTQQSSLTMGRGAGRAHCQGEHETLFIPILVFAERGRSFEHGNATASGLAETRHHGVRTDLRQWQPGDGITLVSPGY
jgi:hypothetical protein